MKKLLIALACFGLAGMAQAQTVVCVDFVEFCDGIEYTVTPGVGINGVWQTYDCAGSDSDTTVTFPVSPGNFRTICAAPAGCELAVVNGLLVVILDLDIPNAAGEVTVVLPDGSSFVNFTSLAISPGACPFGAEGGNSILRQ